MAVLKEDIHKLVDTTEDKNLLEGIYLILSGRNDYEEGTLWTGLTDAQKQEVIDSEQEVEDESKWISHQDVKAKHSKWLK